MTGPGARTGPYSSYNPYNPYGPYGQEAYSAEPYMRSPASPRPGTM